HPRTQLLWHSASRASYALRTGRSHRDHRAIAVRFAYQKRWRLATVELPQPPLMPTPHAWGGSWKSGEVFDHSAARTGARLTSKYQWGLLSDLPSPVRATR